MVQERKQIAKHAVQTAKQIKGKKDKRSMGREIQEGLRVLYRSAPISRNIGDRDNNGFTLCINILFGLTVDTVQREHLHLNTYDTARHIRP